MNELPRNDVLKILKQQFLSGNLKEYDHKYDKTVAGNEGGSGRPSVGVKLPWCQFAADRLATSHSISGCRGQIEMLLS